jgi:porin
MFDTTKRLSAAAHPIKGSRVKCIDRYLGRGCIFCAICPRLLFQIAVKLKAKEMMIKQRLFAVALMAIASCPAIVAAQSVAPETEAAGVTAPSNPVHQRNIEDLNLLGADVVMPPFSDSVINVDSAFRRDLASHGLALRVSTLDNYFQNTLDAPVSKAEQVYVGERPTWMAMINPILTYDLRAFHLYGAQLNAQAGFLRTDWNPNGPETVAMTSLYLYKSFAEGRVETKLGYQGNDREFVAMQVGGSIAGGAQGVYAILPFEVGLSHFPQPAPSFNIKVHILKDFYGTAAAQRSLDQNGAIATNARNSTGFRFDPKGERLLGVFETGYKHNATADSLKTFVRGGYLRNASSFANALTGGTSTGNYCGYILADQQLLKKGLGSPEHGFYAGGTAMVTPATLNPYSHYFEARLYEKGAFGNRERDMLSLVGTHTAHSTDITRNLASLGQSFWRSSTTIAGSYNLAIHSGMYLLTGVTYEAGPAISPRVPNALVFGVQLNCFF